MFHIKSSFDGGPAEFTWLGPGDWTASPGALAAECFDLIADGEQLGLTPTGPWFDAGAETAAQAFALAQAAFDANGDPIELLEGELPVLKPLPDDAIA